ncbi:hypothetical protein [Okeania sp. SIO1I7]|nr:hypothetical protein [Okeania sp. SIO1I7]NET29790.1 hypothetical protein [Okeania sp. SIO1I7]
MGNESKTVLIKEGRRKKEEGRRQKEEGRRQKAEGRRFNCLWTQNLNNI